MVLWVRNSSKIQKEDFRLVICASKPAIIQAGEIIKVQTDLFLKIDPGFILVLSTHQELINKATEIFPSTINLDHTFQNSRNGFLEVPIRNCGRSQLNLVPNNPIVVGHVLQLQTIQIKEWDVTSVPDQEKHSVPQKKNVGIRFELK